MRGTTSPNNLVKDILYEKNLISSAIEYGKKNEKIAIAELEEIIKEKVLPSGLYVDVDFGFLGASPDGGF